MINYFYVFFVMNNIINTQMTFWEFELYQWKLISLLIRNWWHFLPSCRISIVLDFRLPAPDNQKNHRIEIYRQCIGTYQNQFYNMKMTWKLHIQDIFNFYCACVFSWLIHTSIENPALDKQNVPYDLLSEDILKRRK